MHSLRPPFPDYKENGVVFCQINPGYAGSRAESSVIKKYKTPSRQETA
jgi:hypothetical protein